MDDDVTDRSIHKVLFWTKLQENSRFNPDAAKVLKAKAKLLEALKPSSIVYRRRQKLPGPLNAQFQNFRLAPLTGLQDVAFELRDSPNKTGKVLSELNVWSEREKTWRPSTSPALFPNQLITDSAQERQSSSRQSDHSSTYTCSESYASTPLPVFRRREPTSVFLLRRPNVEKPIPLSEDDELFVALTNTIDLKALPFKKQTDSYKFYEKYYPLLLTGTSKEEDRSTTPSRRSRTPESPMSFLINRQRALNMRLVELESLMEQLEKETEDCEFITELHDPTFNPKQWPWNKTDDSGLRGRYTPEASLREM